MRLLIIFFAIIALQGEYLRVEQGITGLDCASCAKFIEGKLGRNPGVASVSTDQKKGVVTVVLKPGNKVRLGQVRDFVQQSGYKLKETNVTVVGTPWVEAGITTLKIAETSDVIRVRDEESKLRQFYNKKVEVKGKVEIVQSGEAKIDILIPDAAVVK